MLAYQIATEPTKDALLKLRLFTVLYVVLGVLIGFALQVSHVSIDSTLAFIIAGIFSAAYILTYRKVRKITRMWIRLRGYNIEANTTTRDVFRTNREYKLKIIPFVLSGASLALIWIAVQLPMFPMYTAILYTAIHVSSVGFVASLLDLRHDVVTAREWRKSRRKERSDHVDMDFDWSQ